MISRRLLGLLAVPLALTGLSGCGPDVGTPDGKVTHKGAPVTGAELRFQPADNPDVMIMGQTGENGSYAIDYAGRSGFPVGKYTVTVTTVTQRNGDPVPDGEEGAVIRADPERSRRQSYVFEKDIPAGSATIDFDLADGTPQSE